MFKKALVITMALLISGFMVTLSAAPKKKACNDLKSEECKKRKDCEWIKGHKTKDGKDVKAYCKCKGKCD